MALAVDIMHRRGLSNEMCHQLQPRKTKVRLYVIVIAQDEYDIFVITPIKASFGTNNTFFLG